MKTFFLQFALTIGVILIGAGIFKYLAATRPEPIRQEAPRVLPRIGIETANPGTVRLEVLTQGTVRALDRNQIRAEVGGRVIEVADRFNEGIRVRAGERLLTIEPADYEAALAAAEATLAEARLALALEEAQAEQARIDWKQLHPEREPDPLVVREPQVAARRARVASAEAAVDRARRDLERTRVVAPFDGRIRSRQISRGDIIPPGNPTLLGEIDGTVLELRLPIAPRQRALLPPGAFETPLQTDLPVVLSSTDSGPQREWKAVVDRFSGTIDPENGFTYAIARIANEATVRPPRIGAFLDARIGGRTVEGVYRIPRVAILRDAFILEARPVDPIREEDTFTLHQTPITLIQSMRETAIVRIEGHSGPIRYSTTPIRAFSAGMAVHRAIATATEAGPLRFSESPTGDTQNNP